MNFRLRIWRQKNRQSPGKLVDYQVRDISPNTSFLEMLDILNEQLLDRGEEPIAFDSDCREGICGTCSLTVNGEAHGPDHPGAVCELYMRKFRDGDTITIEPFRVGPFPNRMLIWPWRRRPASAAAHARQRARTDRQCFSLLQRFRTCRFCLRAAP